jgi:hypothetical protein
MGAPNIAVPPGRDSTSPGRSFSLKLRGGETGGSTGAQAGRVLFLYRPARAGGLIKEQQRIGRKFGSMNERELAGILQRRRWELLGPSPL